MAGCPWLVDAHSTTSHGQRATSKLYNGGVTARWLAILLGAGCAWAQSVRVYSEFQRIDPFGNIVAADRAETPREILSPALVRNARASFLVAVTPPPDTPYALFIGLNPEKSVGVTVYRALFLKRGEGWIPDGLEPVKLSETGEVETAAAQAPGQTTFLYWLDVWVDHDAPVRRTRLELQLNWGGRWFICPLELRILMPRAPAVSGALEPLAAVEAASAESARAALAGYVCGAPAGGEDGPLTIRKLIRRNARQDMALARSMEGEVGRAGLVTELIDAVGGPDAAGWCKTPPAAGERGAEWYLRARDYLYRTADRVVSAGLPGGNVTITVHDSKK